MLGMQTHYVHSHPASQGSCPCTHAPMPMQSCCCTLNPANAWLPMPTCHGAALASSQQAKAPNIHHSHAVGAPQELLRLASKTSTCKHKLDTLWH